MISLSSSFYLSVSGRSFWPTSLGGCGPKPEVIQVRHCPTTVHLFISKRLGNGLGQRRLSLSSPWELEINRIHPQSRATV